MDLNVMILNYLISMLKSNKKFGRWIYDFIGEVRGEKEMPLINEEKSVN